MTTATTTYYHVAGEHWTPGTDLLCWNTLEIEGEVAAENWKWADAEPGFDGDVVCLFDDRSDTDDFASEYGGRVLRVEIPDPAMLTRVEEGYPAVQGRIPAEWIVSGE